MEVERKPDRKRRRRLCLIPIVKYKVITDARPTRFHPKLYWKWYIREFIRLVRNKDHIVTTAGVALLTLPALSIPFAELSLSALLGSPIIVPSPVGMELCDVCTTMLFASLRPNPRIRNY